MADRAGSVSSTTIRQEIVTINSSLIDRSLASTMLSATTTRILQGAAGLDPPRSPPQDPIDADTLLLLLQSCDADILDGATLACAYSFAFLGLFRPGELSRRTPAAPKDSVPRLKDVILVHSGISLRLSSSKTSQYQPVWVHIGSTTNARCPLAAFTNMMRIRKAQAPRGVPVFF